MAVYLLVMLIDATALTSQAEVSTSNMPLLKLHTRVITSLRSACHKRVELFHKDECNRLRELAAMLKSRCDPMSIGEFWAVIHQDRSIDKEAEKLSWDLAWSIYTLEHYCSHDDNG